MPLVEGESSTEGAGAGAEIAEAGSAAAFVDEPPAHELSLSVLDTYKIMLEIMRLRAVQHYIALLIVVKVDISFMTTMQILLTASLIDGLALMHNLEDYIILLYAFKRCYLILSGYSFFKRCVRRWPR